VWYGHKTAVGEATCRRVTYRSGQAAEAIVCQEAARLEQEGFAETKAPERLVLSADGSFIHLTNGEWRIDYPYFQRRGYPIGSGSVESAHKQVVQRRFKQAGMRWAPQNVDPLLALRDLICNKRWSEGRDNIVDYHWQQRHHIVRQRKEEGKSKLSASVTFPALKATGLLDSAQELDEMLSQRGKPKKDPKDHPWRNNKWPTQESWRWNKSHQQN
jgi:hypothetical protein